MTKKYLLIIMLITITSSGLAYNRSAATAYAIVWGIPSVANTVVYELYAADCANFVSQCLIAGGIKFKHGDNYIHCMFISDVILTEDHKDLKICGHNSWRSNEELSTTSAGNNWVLPVIRLDDAPIIKSYRAFSGGNEVRLGWYQRNNKYTWSANGARIAGKQDLVIELTFDTDMDINTRAWVCILEGPGVYTNIQPYTESDFNENGWWTGTDGNYIHNRTWRGKIFGYQLPIASKIYPISVSAEADDGSCNDFDNDLSEYTTTAPCSRIGIWIDTKITTGKKK